MVVKNHDEKGVVIEGIDDIVLLNNDQTDLYQSKFQINGEGSLTDRSPDFWKTIRVWCEGIVDNSINPLKTKFAIVTTGKCAENSIIGKFIKDRNTLNQTINDLNLIATEVSNQTNIKGYTAWNNQSKLIKTTILSNLEIIDQSLDFSVIDDELKRNMRLHILPEHIDAFYDRLSGWWFNCCINQLTDSNQTPILFTELRKYMNELSLSFKLDTLPIDFIKPLEISDEDKLSSEQYTFVKQLELIAVNTKTLRNAISDYRRAFAQRAAWVREDLLQPSEEDRYEATIFEDWKALFDLMDEDEDDSVNSIAGKVFYEDYYVKRIPPIYIRDKVRNPFLFRGSSHILANTKKIGWHPKYKDYV